MYGVTKITSEQNIMMITFTDVKRSDALANALHTFATKEIVVDMICQTAPRTANIDFSFTTNSLYFETVMKALSDMKSAGISTPMVSRGYSKINLFGEEMVTSCGVASKALMALAKADVDIELITTSDLDISLLVREENEDLTLQTLQTTFAL